MVILQASHGGGGYFLESAVGIIVLRLVPVDGVVVLLLLLILECLGQDPVRFLQVLLPAPDSQLLSCQGTWDNGHLLLSPHLEWYTRINR